MMEYRDKVRIAAMQVLMGQNGLSAADIAERVEVFVKAMCKERKEND